MKLTNTQHDELRRLEQVVESNMEAALNTYEALREIRDRKLFAGAYDSWDDYCRTRWEITPQWVNAQLRAEAVRKELGATSPQKAMLSETPMAGPKRPILSDRAAEAAAKIKDPDTRKKVVNAAAAKTGGRPTAKAIREEAEPSTPVRRISVDDVKQQTRKLRSGEQVVTPAQRKKAHEALGQLIRAMDRLGMFSRVENELNAIREAIEAS